ncbi:hypothetical protein DFH08DRAFT_957488 [Mycena albidolilacea]|uniref:Uncharacterized protein n=1 Tax=Mycena albidolilacea TaxID=1033008 RepID=A0AAD7A9H4_9AGAR|nr:hypothetical protein DFH08DRAFT_957488 [Mycena albidolilacea]
MVNCALFGRRKTRTSGAPSRLNINGEETSTPRLLSRNHIDDANTVLPTALQTTLRGLISSVPADLVPVVGDLSALTKRIKTPANVHGLGELAALLERLRPAVIDLAHKNTNEGQVFVEDLKRELQSLTEDLEVAWSQNRLDEFFNAAAHNTSPFEKHSLALVQIIADSALVTAHKVLKSARETEYQGRRLHKSSPSVIAPIVSGNVTGGIGGTGGIAQTGGEGGKGQGPRLDLEPNEHYRIGNISGGTGGAGGIGIEIGGKGGTGEGPVIINLRDKNLEAASVKPVRATEDKADRQLALVEAVVTACCFDAFRGPVGSMAVGRIGPDIPDAGPTSVDQASGAESLRQAVSSSLFLWVQDKRQATEIAGISTYEVESSPTPIGRIDRTDRLRTDLPWLSFESSPLYLPSLDIVPDSPPGTSAYPTGSAFAFGESGSAFIPVYWNPDRISHEHEEFSYLLTTPARDA